MDLKPSIDYFNSLTDSRGIVQFAQSGKKSPESGYAVEDQARALIIALNIRNKILVETLLSAIFSSLDKTRGVCMWVDKDGKSGNKYEYDTEAPAEVFWSLSMASQMKLPGSVESKKAKEAIVPLIKKLLLSESVRANAYSLLGLCENGDIPHIEQVAGKLVARYKNHSVGNWNWFEEELTYANAIIPWSLLASYQKVRKVEYLKTGIASLSFLTENLVRVGRPVVVGNKGWWKKGNDMALFDQQPIDVSYMVLCLLKAFEITKRKDFLDKAGFYYSWFEGNNLLGKRMIKENGACSDGLNSDGPNPDSGAESNICFLMASLALKNASQK